MSTKSDIYDYLKTFLIQNNWQDEYTREQGRALWTSYCLIAGLDVDVWLYDNDLQILFNISGVVEIMSYEDFKNYMSKLLV